MRHFRLPFHSHLTSVQRGQDRRSSPRSFRAIDNGADGSAGSEHSLSDEDARLEADGLAEDEDNHGILRAHGLHCDDLGFASGEFQG